jgi:FLYWCH zinc finger domain
MISGREKYPDFTEEFVYKEELVKPSAVTIRAPPKKKDRVSLPSSTSYNVPFQFLQSGRRNQVMICEGQKYIQNNKYGEKIYWKCSKWHDGCKARAITLQSQPECITRRNEHNHPENISIKEEGEKDNE